MNDYKALALEIKSSLLHLKRMIRVYIHRSKFRRKKALPILMQIIARVAYIAACVMTLNDMLAAIPRLMLPSPSRERDLPSKEEWFQQMCGKFSDLLLHTPTE